MNASMKSLRSLVLTLVVRAFPAFLSSQANPNSLNVGVAQMNGKIRRLRVIQQRRWLTLLSLWLTPEYSRQRSPSSRHAQSWRAMR